MTITLNDKEAREYLALLQVAINAPATPVPIRSVPIEEGSNIHYLRHTTSGADYYVDTEGQTDEKVESPSEHLEALAQKHAELEGKRHFPVKALKPLPTPSTAAKNFNWEPYLTRIYAVVNGTAPSRRNVKTLLGTFSKESGVTETKLKAKLKRLGITFDRKGNF